MPRKIRELMRDLQQAGFIIKSGRGSHRKYRHPKGMFIMISGNTGDDARPYQENKVREIIKESRS